MGITCTSRRQPISSASLNLAKYVTSQVWISVSQARFQRKIGLCGAGICREIRPAEVEVNVWLPSPTTQLNPCQKQRIDALTASARPRQALHLPECRAPLTHHKQQNDLCRPSARSLSLTENSLRCSNPHKCSCEG